MYFLLISIIFGLSILAFRLFMHYQTQPVYAPAIPTKVHAEGVVPTYSNEPLSLEPDPDFDKEWEQYKPVLIEEADTVLLLEAEKLVTEVEIIAASNHDVHDRLKLLIPGYALLQKTEYYEPINTFIRLTVRNLCGIELSDKDLKELWD